MQWILQFLIQHRNLSSLTMTVLLSLWMLNANLVSQHRVARFLEVTVFLPVQIPVSQFQRIKNVFGENKSLRRDVVELRLKVAALEDQTAENRRLRGMLDLRASLPFSVAAARVIAREPSAIYRGCVIDAGLDKKVELYMPVISRDGVIGKVTQVLGSCAYVQLLRDPLERASVMLKRTGEAGILQSIDGRSFFANYRQHADVNKGDTVVTSGYGGIYPRGLPVGVVSEIRNANGPLFKDVYVRSFANFERLDEVFILRVPPRWGYFRQQIDSVKMGDDLGSR